MDGIEVIGINVSIGEMQTPILVEVPRVVLEIGWTSTSDGEQSATYFLEADFAEELAQKLSAAARLIVAPGK